MEKMSELIEHAKSVYKENFEATTCFERALFFSWGCTIGDCTFCYMSTQPSNKEVRETRRSLESLYAEALLSRHLGWEIGFLTGGIGAFNPEEIVALVKEISSIVHEKVWLSIGPIPKPFLLKCKPFIKGVVGSTETINPVLHKVVCPSKPLKPYEQMFEVAKELDLERAMTFIVGMGETHDDFKLLKAFIKKYGITKIHVYGLIPQKGTMFENSKPPTAENQAWWIANLRISFPKLDIQCGIWEDRADRITLLLNAGANSISKFQALKLFGLPVAHDIEKSAKLAGREFLGTLTKLPQVDWNNEIESLPFPVKQKELIKKKLFVYLKTMEKNVKISTAKVV